MFYLQIRFTWCGRVRKPEILNLVDIKNEVWFEGQMRTKINTHTHISVSYKKNIQYYTILCKNGIN